MPITATCSNCGKSYQAPDAMAGKSVRCKACQTVFRIDVSRLDEPAPGDLDFDALEQSFAADPFENPSAGPTVDAKGKISIRRAADVADIGLAGDGAASVRSNFRYRFPLAKEIDQFLPWVLVVACLGILLRWCLTSEIGAGATPPTGVALSRFFLLIGTYTVLVFPAAHIAIIRASRNLRFSMPRAAAWRTFTGFLPLLLLGAGLYMLSGGAVGGLIFGIILGTVVSVGTITILYRLFPNELPVVSFYASGAAVLSGTFGVASLFAINLVALSIANLSAKEPETFISPVALGLRWQERPAAPVEAIARPTVPTPATGDVPPTTGPTTDTTLSMPTLPVPELAAGQPNLVSGIDLPPVTPAFDKARTTPVESDVLWVLRDDRVGAIESFNTVSWKRIVAGTGFQRGESGIVTNTIGDVAMRIVSTPSYRIEAIQLGRSRAPDPIQFDDPRARTLFGFVNERILLVMVHEGKQLLLERYDVTRGVKIGSAVPFGFAGPEPHEVASVTSAVRMTPDGKYILVAARANDGHAYPARLTLYKADDVSTPFLTRELPLAFRFLFQPIGLAINNGGRVAMLLDTNDEAYFTMWQFLDEVVDRVAYRPPLRQTIDRKLGVLSEMRPPGWESDYDGLVWINERSLLLFGTYVIDARTGTILGKTGIDDIVGQVREHDNVVNIIQQKQNGFRTLLRVRFDPEAIDATQSR